MPRKKKSQEEPEAIVHTRAVLIKQGEELTKLMATERANVNKAEARLEDAENAHGVVQVALASLGRKIVQVPRKAKQKVHTGAKKKKKRSVKLDTWKRAKLYNAVKNSMHPGQKYTPFAVHKKVVSSNTWAKKITYRQIWGVLQRLCQQEKVFKLESGDYKLLGPHKKRAAKTTKKKVAKKKATQKKPRRGGRRAAWMDPADKFFAMYDTLTPSQLQNMVKDSPDAPTVTAVTKYLYRQVQKGNLK